MELFYREFNNKGSCLVIIHGLYGASDNWVSIARKLEKHYHIFLIDQRNHGRSPHRPQHDYESMANDLLSFFDLNQIRKAHIIGHSMGGKAAMHFALKNPQRVYKLAVLDIAPKPYKPSKNLSQLTNNHAVIIDSMLNADLQKAKSRQDVEHSLEQKLPDKKLRQFLLKNVDRDKEGKYRWKVNLQALKKNLNLIMDGFSELNPKENQSNIPAIFIRGEKSDYVSDDDLAIIKSYFRNSEIVTIPDSGHWLHAEQPELLIKTLKYFLTD